MANAAAGGGGPDFLMLAAVGAMAFLALRSRGAVAAGGVPARTAGSLRPDYGAQRDLGYAQIGAGLLGSILGGLGRSGSPDQAFAPVTGIFGGSLPTVLDYNASGGYLGTAMREATDGFTPAEFGRYNGAYTFGSPVEAPSADIWAQWTR